MSETASVTDCAGEQLLAAIESQDTFRPDPHLVTIPGVTEVRDAQIEWTASHRRNESSSIATVIGPGYFGVDLMYGAAREAGAWQNGVTVTVKPPRRQEHHHIHDDFHPTALLPAALWAVVKDVQDELGIELVDLLGHSMGGRAVAQCATYQARRFLRNGEMHKFPIRSVTMADSVGSTGHNPLELSARSILIAKQLHNKQKDMKFASADADRMRRARRETRNYLRDNPIRTLQEGFCCGMGDLRRDLDFLNRVKFLSPHSVEIPTAVLTHEDDSFFPGARARKHLRNSPTLIYSGTPAYGADHFAPQLFPEEFMQDHGIILDQIL